MCLVSVRMARHNAATRTPCFFLYVHTKCMATWIEKEWRRFFGAMDGVKDKKRDGSREMDSDISALFCFVLH